MTEPSKAPLNIGDPLPFVLLSLIAVGAMGAIAAGFYLWSM